MCEGPFSDGGRDRIEQEPSPEWLVASLDVDLERRRLTHHLYARCPNRIEVACHSYVSVAVELQRDDTDIVVGIDSAGDEVDPMLRHGIAQHAYYCASGLDDRGSGSARSGADLDLTTGLERNAAAVRQSPRRGVIPG